MALACCSCKSRASTSSVLLLAGRLSWDPGILSCCSETCQWSQGAEGTLIPCSDSARGVAASAWEAQYKVRWKKELVTKSTGKAKPVIIKWIHCSGHCTPEKLQSPLGGSQVSPSLVSSQPVCVTPKLPAQRCHQLLTQASCASFSDLWFCSSAKQDTT